MTPMFLLINGNADSSNAFVQSNITDMADDFNVTSSNVNQTGTGNKNIGSSDQFFGKRPASAPLGNEQDKARAVEGRGSDPKFVRLHTEHDGEGEDGSDGGQGSSTHLGTLGKVCGDSFSASYPRFWLDVMSPTQYGAIPLPSQCSETTANSDILRK
jgi:hypothetical protein